MIATVCNAVYRIALIACTQAYDQLIREQIEWSMFFFSFVRKKYQNIQQKTFRFFKFKRNIYRLSIIQIIRHKKLLLNDIAICDIRYRHKVKEKIKSQKSKYTETTQVRVQCNTKMRTRIAQIFQLCANCRDCKIDQ